MFSNRTTQFLAVVILIAITALATISMDNPPHSVFAKPVPEAIEQGLAIYRQSEKAFYSASNIELGLAQYHRSEWGLSEPTLNEPQDAGLAIYFASERGIRVRDLSAFNAYQRSEWFGQ
jgi:hypothetical protein